MTDDHPVCDCYEGYHGKRCEVDKCFNFCLEDGVCVIIEDEPECLCKEGYEGDRCHIERLPGIIRSQGHFLNTTSATNSSQITTMVYILGGTTGVLSILVVVLSVFLHKMRLRPRLVRKRFISVAGPSRISSDNKLI